MSARNRFGRNTVAGVFLLLCVLCLSAYCAWGELEPFLFAEEEAVSLVSPAPPAKAPSVPLAARKSEAAPSLLAEEPLAVPAPLLTENADVAPVLEPVKKNPPPPSIAPSPSQTASRETVGLLSVLLGELEVRRAELALMEVSKKIEELNTPPPVVIAAPVEKPAPPPAVPKVVAIEGMGGRLRALVRTERGLRTVAAGEALDLGRVIKISLDSVQYEDRDGKLTTLPVED
ncbi:MAG: hypothetical protein LBP61_05635 [Desulfovibrio sp.]|jgi:type IV pilus biogenesis protein PilP|nr:hypothetical protein [Desulfovibrio sp.]